MRGKSNMENRKNRQPTKIDSQRYSMGRIHGSRLDLVPMVLSRAICPRICNQKPICRSICKVARHRAASQSAR